MTIRLIRIGDEDAEPEEGTSEVIEVLPRVLAPGDDVTVTMRRAEVPATKDQALWAVIRNSTNRLGFNN